MSTDDDYSPRPTMTRIGDLLDSTRLAAAMVMILLGGYQGISGDFEMGMTLLVGYIAIHLAFFSGDFQ